MSAKYKSPSFLLPNELNTSANPANDTGINSLYSMNFDSTTRIPNITGLGLGTSVDTFSISLWFYKSNMNYSILFSAYSGSGSYFQTGVSIELNTNGTIMFFNGAARTTTSAQYSANTWYNLVVTSDGTTVKMYVNGSQVTLDSTTAQARNFTNVWINSAAYSSNNFGITGKIDEVAIFNRALSTTEISALYDGSGSNIRPSNLMATDLNPIAYYPLGEQAQMQGYLGNEASSEWQFPNGVLQDYVMDFDGGSVTTPSTYSGLDGANKLTISFWVKSTSAVTSVPLRIGTSPNRQIYITIQSSGRIVFRKNENGDNTYLRADSGTPHDGNWNHILISMDLTASSRGGIYFNGNNITYLSTLDTNAIQTSTGSLLVGDSANFVGNIAQLAIWSGTDLRNDVATIYNNGSPNDLNNNGLTAPTTWWKLNADSVYTPSAPNYTTALDFDSSQSDYIDLGNITALNNLSSFSSSSWFKTSNVSTAPIILNGGSSISNRFYLQLLSGTTIRYVIGSSVIGTSVSNVADGNWHHIATTQNGTSLDIYLDGAKQNTSTITVVSPSANIGDNFKIGRYFLSAVNYFDGQISNAAIFNSALSASQISTLFNFGTPETNISFSPTAWWKLDDQTTITDYSGNGNTGTNNGATDISSGVAVTPSWKIPSALPITSTPNYTKAFNFRGSSQNDSVSIGSLSSFQSDVDTSNAFSISLWIKTSYTGVDAGTLFGNQAVNWQPHETTFLRVLSGGYLQFSVLTNPSQTPSNYYRIYNQLDRSINDNKWHHICCTIGVNPSTTYLVSKVYIDGVLAQEVLTTQQGAYMSQINTVNNDYYIGARASNVTSEYDGDISNLQIFDSEIPASGSNSVSSLYNGGTPLTSMSGFTSLKGWWKLDDTATFSTNWTIPDASSNNNTGTSSGMTIANRVDSDVLATQPVNGVSTTLPSTALQQSDLQFDSPYSNYSLSFDGTGDYIDCTDISYFSGADRFTLSTWFKVTDNPSTNTNRDIISKGSTTSGTTSFFIRKGKNTNLNKISVSFNEGTINVPGTTQLQNDVWYHLTVVYKGYESNNADRAKIYINGVDDTGSYTNTVPTTLVSSTQPLRIGRWASGTDFFGKIDETAIWQSVLTDAQILQVYNNGKPSDITSLSPNYWWRLGENAYFDNNSFVAPNSISGAPNGTGSGTITTMISADAPGTYANGIGENLDILDRVGDAPLSTSNSQSYNMIPDNKSPYVPAYVGLQTNNIYSMSFNGIDEYIETNYTGLNGLSQSTISIWANTSNVTLGRFLYGNRDTSNNGVACQTWTDGNIYFYVSSASSLYFNMASAGIQNNQWFNLVFVFDGSQSSNTDKVKMYVNGNLITYTTSTTFPTTLQTSSKSFKIGNDEQANAYWNGQIDEVAIWDTALNAGQIFNDLYQPTATATNKTADLVNNPNLPNPVAWYRMGD